MDVYYKFRHYREHKLENFFRVMFKHISMAMDSGQIKKHFNEPENLNKCKNYTICHVMKGNEIKSIGYAFCSPSDQFSRERGRTISLRRARYQGIKENMQDIKV